MKVKEIVNIEFNLPKSENVQMVIYNLQGQVMKVLTPSKYAAGKQLLQVNIADLPYGNYILQLITSEEQVSLPIIKF